MIREMQKLMDGSYILNWGGPNAFYGSRIDLIEWLDEKGFTVEEAGTILRVLDSLPVTGMPSTTQGYA
jgi:hypothetical protein